MGLVKIVERGLTVDKGFENVIDARAAMLRYIGDLTVDELPMVNQLVDEDTDEVYETHCFALEHHTHEGDA